MMNSQHAEPNKIKKGWQPANREREVSFALKVFGHFATSADKGAVRDKTLLK